MKHLFPLILAMAILFSLPRTAPAQVYAGLHGGITLPQGFFIQVFLATQSLILQAISQLTGIWVPFFVMVLYIISTYKQLFGYRWWGTIWRTITNIIIGFSMVFLLSLFTYMITKIVT